MRLSNFLVTFSACALFAACANDETPDGNNLPQGNGEQAFIAVRLAAPNAMTRMFQDGKDEENAVTNARFYFFDNSGNAVTVGKAGETEINYYDVNSPSFSASNPTGDNVEETTTNAIVVLENKTVWPTQMVVVLNPPTALDNASKSLTDLRGIAAGYDSKTSGAFVMSNSVYIDGANGKVDAVNVEDHITNDLEAAKGNPVTVYVERVLARVDVACTSNLETDKTDGTGTQQSEINGYSGSNDANEIQAVIKGWTLANRNAQSHLLKSLSTWDNSTSIEISKEPASSWAFATWNDAANHRSYWAYTDDVTATKLANDSYATILSNNSTFAATDYCQENTGNGKATELVAIAELQVDNQPADIAKYAGQYWTVDNLLKQFAEQILSGKIYYKANAGDPTNVTALPADALKLRPRNSTETSTVAAYEAVLDLKADYQTGYTFYSDATGNNTIELTAVQDILNDYKALYWKDGKTYYHTTIKHTLNSLSKDGVVRNHLYKVSLTGVSGLGTPIPGTSSDDEDDDPGTDDPDDKPIDPENPDEEESFLAAEINILSWNVIGQDVELGKD